MTGSGVPVVLALSRAERRLVEGLRRAGATNAGAARPLDPRGLQAGRLEKLLEAGVILEATPGAYYVDETAYQRYRQNKRMTVVAVLAALLLVAVLFLVARLFSSGRRADRSQAPGTDTLGTSAQATSPADASPASPAWTLSETGWGPIRAGMSVAEARAAVGGELPEPANRECDHVRPPRGPAGVLLMVVAGRLARVEVSDTTVATAAGVRVGDTEARVTMAYPGRVRTSPHKYVDGHYLTVPRGTGADSIYRLVFETDGQRVTRFRGGRFPEVEWVEGCS